MYDLYCNDQTLCSDLKLQVQHYLSPVSTPMESQTPSRSHHGEASSRSLQSTSDPTSRSLHPHLSITTPHLTLPVSSTVSSSSAVGGGIMLPQQTLQPGGYGEYILLVLIITGTYYYSGYSNYLLLVLITILDTVTTFYWYLLLFWIQ